MIWRTLMFCGVFLIFLLKLHASEFIPIKFSASDETVGRYFHQISKDLKNDRLDKNNVSNLKHALKKSDAFSELTPLVNRLEKVANIGRDVKKFHDACEKINGEKNNTHLTMSFYKSFEEKIQKYCRGVFLKIAPKKEDEKILAFIEQSIPYYLAGERKEFFTHFFENLDPKSSFYQNIENLITEKYLLEKITPRENIVKSLELNHKLTSYVQARGLWNRENRNLFNQEFLKIYDNYKTAFHSQNIKKAIKIAQRLKLFHETNNTLIEHDMSWLRFLIIGKQLATTTHIQEAIHIIDYSLEMALQNNQNNINEDQINASLFQLLWTHTTKENYKEALRIVDAYKILENFKSYDSRIQFWAARIVHHANHPKLAYELYGKLIKNSPMSFYSIIATKELKAYQDSKYPDLKSDAPPIEQKTGKEKKSKTKFSQLQNKNSQKYVYNKNFQNNIKRLKVWMKLGLDTESNQELNDIIAKGSEDVFALALTSKRLPAQSHEKLDNIQPFLIKNLSALFNKQEKYLHTFKLIHGSLYGPHIEADDDILSYLFPFQYFEDIKKLARDIDPILVISLIRQESAFNPEAKSSVGARGLMQLMPLTAKQMNNKTTIKDLLVPKTNIELGIKYLKRLLNKYNGNLIHTLAAYNAGESRVSEWQKTLFTSDDPLVQIESIPFKETRNYVKLIYRNMYFYRLLMNDSADGTPLGLSIADSFKTSLNQTTN